MSDTGAQAKGERNFVEAVALASISTALLTGVATVLLLVLLAAMSPSLGYFLEEQLIATPLWDWYDHGVTLTVLYGIVAYCLLLIPVSWWLRGETPAARWSYAALMVIAVIAHLAAAVVIHIAALKLIDSFPELFAGAPWFLPLVVLLNVGTVGVSCLLFAWVGWRVALLGDRRRASGVS